MPLVTIVLSLVVLSAVQLYNLQVYHIQEENTFVVNQLNNAGSTLSVLYLPSKLPDPALKSAIQFG
jgi:hypothetical protein